MQGEHDSPPSASLNQQGQDALPRQSAPQPPPFNPLLSHAGQGQSLGHSVVPDLMKIYESLTQSKTPQTRPSQSGGNGHGLSEYQQQQHQQPPQYIYHLGQPSHYYPPARQNVFAPPPQHGYATQHGQPQPDYEDSVPVPVSSGRSLRKRSSASFDEDKSSEESASRSRKKKKSDGRWSKRFTWPDDLHRDFVAAIFDVGLKHASPSAILEHMPQHEQITSERVKSHLQKYRLHRLKSKQEFMSAYEASLNNYHSTGSKSKELSAAEVAAHLAYCAMTEAEEPRTPIQEKSEPYQESPQDMEATFRSGALVLPKLTEAEKQSPIGAAMGYLVGLFFSLRQQLMASRDPAASGGAPGENVQVPFAPPVVPYVSYPSSADNEPVPEGLLHSMGMAHSFGPGVDASQAHSSHQQDQLSAASASSAAHQTMRTTLEESHLMKREMQNQMAFQNKMRALKQQELNKFESAKHGADGQMGVDVGDGTPQTDDHGRRKSVEDGDVAEKIDERFQETGETAEAGNSNPGSAVKGSKNSLGATDEFWVHDEQLFEFLMNS